MSNGQGERELNPTATERENTLPLILEVPAIVIPFLFEEYTEGRIESIGPNREYETDHFEIDKEKFCISIYPLINENGRSYKAFFSNEKIRNIVVLNTETLEKEYSEIFVLNEDNNWVKQSLDQSPSDLQP